MRIHALALTLAGTPLLVPTPVQESRSALPVPRAHAAPAEPSLGAVLVPGAPLPPPISKNEFRAAGEGLPADPGDGVPLPEPPRFQPGPQGDETLSAGGGDPYFLSFASGPHFPPADERLDPALSRAASMALAAGRTRTYAFVMFAKRMTPARIAVLEQLGIETLSFHPHYCLKVAIPVAAIDACASLEFVRWVGVATPRQKLHPVLTAQRAANQAAQFLDVWINVSESDLGPAPQQSLAARATHWDVGVAAESPATALWTTRSDGWQERALLAQGVEIQEYVDAVQAFRARIAPGTLDALLELDFVQFVEPHAVPELLHDESTPMVSNDIVRAYYNGGNSQAVNVGEVDSGFDVAHQDFTGLWAVAWDFVGGGPLTDGCEHGTHVLGTILGNGNVDSGHRGNAPGLGRFGGTGRTFLARAFNDACQPQNFSLASILAVMNAPHFDGVSISPQPVAINNSWGASPLSGGWIGSEVHARMLDDQIYSSGQAWIFAAGNSGPGASTLSQEASAKNVLSVGSATDFEVGGLDPGILAGDSSHGPCGDGRWKPNVCAPGTLITSVDANSGNGYKEMSGTSMAAPHVTGLVAQLCDAVPWVRYRSCAIQSVLMASATTKDNVTLSAPSSSGSHHLNTFGAGRIDGVRSVLGTADSYWNTWTFDQSSFNWNYGDFVVPPGTTRIVVCMHYDEGAASPGAGQALVNNWDLYIDEGPVDPVNGNTGEWVAQQSLKDNTEIRILDNPTATSWRWKVWPQAVTFNSTVRMGVTVYFVLGSTTPAMSVQTSVSDLYVKPNEATSITSLVRNSSSFTASAVFLDAADTAGTVEATQVTLFDGAVADLVDNAQGGHDVLLGNIPLNYSRSVTWSVNWPLQGVWPWATTARGDNFAGVSDNSAYVVVDGVGPDVPVPGSTTHFPWTWANSGFAQLTWPTPGDNLSGVEGYAVSISQGWGTDPGTTMSLGAVNNWSAGLLSSATPSYFNIRAVDRSGNWSHYASYGPMFVDYTPPPAATNVGSALSPGYWVGGAGLSSFGGYWDTVTDLESGLAGYGVEFDQFPDTIPSIMNEPAGATSIARLVTVSGAYYEHVRAIDNAGNWGPTVHAGPYLYNVNPNTTYCVAKVNSLGCTPTISAVNHGSVYYTSNFVVSASNVRNKKPGLLLYGTNGPTTTPFQGGTLCIRAPVRRTTPVNSGGSPTGDDCSGVYQIDMNSFANGALGGNPQPELLQQGTTVWCQWWGRDPGFAAPNNSTLSDAMEYFVCYY